MPLGIERLNARHQQPNSRIVSSNKTPLCHISLTASAQVFIKPLPGPTAAFAQDFLERIAAICHPIMKAHHLAIMSLEEYEPNPEFVGRNFNAGEVIQLVLRAPRTGHWLGFRSVQMVMMHELAHCKQMNHSGAFWAVRNQFADELRKLWEQNYTGDGFWGKGKTLLSGQYEPVSGLSAETIPRSLCGGTFRSWAGGGRKRKRKGKADGTTVKMEKLTYAERQQRRIAKKFGTHGVKLGDDTETRVKLEDGKKPKGKPRVAGSARGRELRAAAALARFSNQKEEEKDVKPEELDEMDGETESEEEDFTTESQGTHCYHLNSLNLPDHHGKGMVKVCGDEDKADIRVKQEMEELQDLNNVDLHPSANLPSHSNNISNNTRLIKLEDKYSTLPPLSNDNGSEPIKLEAKSLSPPSKPLAAQASENKSSDLIKLEEKPPQAQLTTSTTTSPSNQATHSSPLVNNCPICSLLNPSSPLSTICIACGHVLDLKSHPNHWRCASIACRDSAYVNAGDYGLCGICGARRVKAG